jgi:hypothetical protein
VEDKAPPRLPEDRILLHQENDWHGYRGFDKVVLIEKRELSLKERIMRSAGDGASEGLHLPNYDAAPPILPDE